MPEGTPFLYGEFDCNVVFVVVFVAFIPGGYYSAHFFIKGKGVFVFGMTAKIKFFDFPETPPPVPGFLFINGFLKYIINL